LAGRDGATPFIIFCARQQTIKHASKAKQSKAKQASMCQVANKHQNINQQNNKQQNNKQQPTNNDNKQPTRPPLSHQTCCRGCNTTMLCQT